MPSLRNAAHAATHPLQWFRNRTMKHTPRNIFLFLTNICNLHCEHCFYHFELNKKTEEISLEQIAKLGRSLTRDTFFCLTGGEVTLRKDLADAVLTLAATGKVYFINICTNGFYPERLEALVETVMADGRLPRLGFQISLDGLEQMHNAVRGHKAAYSTSMESLRLLKRLQARYPDRLEYVAHAVLTRHNQHQALDILHATQREGFPLSYSIVRAAGDVFHLPLTAASGFDVKDQDATLGLDVPQWREVIDALFAARREHGYAYPTDLGWRQAAVTLDTLEHKRRMIPCDAGSDDGVIYPNGKVAHCENTRPFADLGDFDYDLRALWHGEAAQAMRAKIRDCACTHACNIVNSLAKRPELYPVPADLGAQPAALAADVGA